LHRSTNITGLGTFARLLGCYRSGIKEKPMGARLVHARKKARRRARAQKHKAQENISGVNSGFPDAGRHGDARRTPATRRSQGVQT
jgi:hypothetical protein